MGYVFSEERTPYAGCATASLSHAAHRHVTHGVNCKFGWALPSAFKILAAVTAPQDVFQSAKDPASFIFVRPVGHAGVASANLWFTLVVVNSVSGEVVTAYNALSYAQGVRSGHECVVSSLFFFAGLGGAEGVDAFADFGTADGASACWDVS